MSKHTAGPWHVVEGDEWTSDIATGEPNTMLVRTVASVNNRRDEAKANKHLIAAAPDLLEALEEFRAAFSVDYEYFFNGRMAAAVVDAERALAKARGES